MYGFACGGKKDEHIVEDHRCWAALAGKAEILQAVFKGSLLKAMKVLS